MSIRSPSAPTAPAWFLDQATARYESGIRCRCKNEPGERSANGRSSRVARFGRISTRLKFSTLHEPSWRRLQAHTHHVLALTSTPLGPSFSEAHPPGRAGVRKWVALRLRVLHARTIAATTGKRRARGEDYESKLALVA